MIIGLSGYAGSGKDTVAQILVEDHGFERLAFARALKDVAYDLDPLVYNDDEGFITSLRRLVDSVGWDKAKRNTEVREHLQRLGVAIRNRIGRDTWVDVVFDQMSPVGKYTISDVRFLSEVTRIRSAGGVVWRVERPCYGPINEHVSETEVGFYNCDGAVNNDGTLENLRLEVARVLAREASE